MTVEELTCKLACQDLITDYFVILDRGDRPRIADLFTEDGEMWGAEAKMADGAGLSALFGSLPPEFVPVHVATNVKVTPTGPDTAEGFAYVAAYNLFGKVDDVLPRPMPPHPNRIGKVLFKFRKTAAGWRISQFRGTVPFVDDGQT